MNLATLLIFAVAAPVQAPGVGDAAGDNASKARHGKLMDLYRGDAAGYTIYRDKTRKEKVELQREPVYVWTNPVRSNGQDGAVFVWTCRGRAEVVGTIFSFPATGPRNLHHELHSLATTVLDVHREGLETWKPEAAGIELKAMPDAPVPARSPSLRFTQMRALTREFSATGEDLDKKRWEQRLLPQPLYRYQSIDPAVIDGAVFSFVSNAGTDPEVLLVLEARKPASGAGGEPVWQYGIGRFSDMKLWVRYKGQEVYTAPLIHWNDPIQDPKQRYRSFRDRVIPPVEEESASK